MEELKLINEREKLGFWTFVFLWFGASVSIAEILTGGLLVPLGFKNGILIILVGHLIGTAIFVLGGITIYYSFVKIDFVLGATVPSMILTSIIYGISWRWISKWKLVRKSQNSYSA